MDLFTMADTKSAEQPKPGGFHTLLYLLLFSVLTQVVGGCIQAGKSDRKHEQILGEIEKLRRETAR